MKRVRVQELPLALKKEPHARLTKAGQVAFVKGGEKPEGSGRKKGQPNHHSKVLKEIIFTAMDMVGQNGKGKNQAAGYLAMVAWKKPELFMPLLAKVLPYSLSGAGGGPVQVEYTNKEDITLRFKERGLPLPTNLLDAPRRKKPSETIDAEYTEVEPEEEDA